MNADWLLTASMARAILFSIDTQIGLVQFEMQIDYLRGSNGGAMIKVVSQICGLLSEYEGL